MVHLHYVYKPRCWFQSFFKFSPLFGEDEPILIFFKGVGSTTN